MSKHFLERSAEQLPPEHYLAEKLRTLYEALSAKSPDPEDTKHFLYHAANILANEGEPELHDLLIDILIAYEA